MLAITEEANEYRKKFHEYYYEKIANDLAKFEQSRKPEFAKYTLWMALTVLTAAVTICCLIYFSQIIPQGFWDRNGPGQAILSIGGLIMVGFYFLGVKVKKNFENKVKEKIIHSFLSFFGAFRWSSKEKIDKEELIESKLVGNNKHMGVTGDDYFEGTYKDVKIIISELSLDIPGNKRRLQIFDGIFVKLSMNKKINSHTIVKEDFSIKTLEGCYHLPQSFSGMDKTELEDPEFNKMFDVYTQDQVEARYILTTSFMERFKRLKEVYKAKEIRASFKDSSTLLIGLSCNKDMFVLGDVRKPITDSGEIQQLFEEFLAVISLVDLLKLDSKTGL
ncbi:MAG: DUF3137 domain-containing protein [Candidatus Gastranaerophilaceae bacterium]